jgi:hypothetical protein
MKNIFIILLCVGLLSNCTETEYTPDINGVLTLIDITDSARIDRINAKDIVPMLSVFNGRSLSGASVGVSLITDLIHSPSYWVHIADEDRDQSNELTRKVTVETFRHSLDSIYDVANSVKSGRNHSEVFRSITDALQTLLGMPYTSKALIIVSDCHENSEQFNSYNPDEIQALVQHPERMDSFIPVQKSLTGIEVFIVHQPASVRDDRIFDVVSNAIKAYLTSKGAVVHIVTSLNQ